MSYDENRLRKPATGLFLMTVYALSWSPERGLSKVF